MKTVELPVLNNQQGSFVSGNCFRYYAFEQKASGDGSRYEDENVIASSYFLKGLRFLHEGYVAASNFYTTLHCDKVRQAFGYFHQALAAKPDYFCAREAVRRTLELLGQYDLAEKEEYALQMSNNPHPEMPCHLLHPGFYSASDLSKLEESLKGREI